MRRLIIAGNWKMNKTVGEAIELANGLKRELFNIDNVDIVLCPPFTALDEVNEIISGANIQLGAQNVYWQQNGAYTGEISCEMLKDLGAKFVIIGHSERRGFFGETDETVNKKLKKVLATGLFPIVCIGETLEEREGGKTLEVVKGQFSKSLKDLSKDDFFKTTIAYEPVWAIGTGRNATSRQAQEVHGFIRKLIEDLHAKETAELVRIQYGGSVTPDNIGELISEPDIDGALVGGASLKVETFSRIVKTAGG